MPLPDPRKSEKRSEYVSRFMSSKSAKKEFPDREQRVAVAYSKWRDERGENMDWRKNGRIQLTKRTYVKLPEGGENITEFQRAFKKAVHGKPP